MSDVSNEPLWTVKDVAAYLRTSTSWVYSHADDGTLPSVRIGGLRRFQPEAIRAYARGEWTPTRTVVQFPGPAR